MSEGTEDDLRDVFKMLYDDASWDLDDEDAPPEVNPTEPEVDAIDEALSEPEQPTTQRYTRKRLLAELDALISKPDVKRPRIYTPRASTSRSVLLSTDLPPDLPNPTDYAPFSSAAFLSRLRTFQPSTYSPYIPESLGPQAAVSRGWINGGRDSLYCGACRSAWSVRGVEEIRDEGVKAEVARRLSAGFVDRHAASCPWRIQWTPDTMRDTLRRLYHPPIRQHLIPLSQGLHDSCLTGADVAWRSPLAESQLEILHKRIHVSPGDTSSPAAAMALFCWYPFHPNSPPGQVLSEARSSDIVQCRVCERRVGLWAFHGGEKQRVFDLEREHLAWCPIRKGSAGWSWWEDLPLLKESAGQLGKGWINISARKEVPSWRKRA